MVNNIAEIKAAVVKDEPQKTADVSPVAQSNSPPPSPTSSISITRGDSLMVKAETKLYKAEDPVHGEIRMLAKGESLIFIRKGFSVSMGGLKAPMVNVKTVDGQDGWCFSGHLHASKPS
jgi:hypothetical protein